MPPRRREGDEASEPLDDDLDTARVPQDGEPVYWPGRGHVPTIIDAPFVETPDEATAPPLPPPILPNVPPFQRTAAPGRRTRRGRNDWSALVIALVVSALVMAACCLAGLALFTTTNR
jgi:hypothetical protein